MRIPSGVTDQYIYFVAVDSTDYATRETGLSSFTVYRSRNGAAAAAMTTPTINETDSTNMPGVYELLLDEDMTIGSGNDSEEMVFHITATGMAPVTRTIELYRSKITAGNTLDVTATGAAGIDWGNVENASTTVDLSATSINLCDTITTYTGNTVQTGDSFARLGAPAGASVSADIATVDSNVDAILVDTSALNDTKIPDTISLANINAEVDTALTDIHLDHLLAADYDPAAKPGTATALLNELIESDAGVSRFTANALEQAPDTDHTGTGSGLSAIPWNSAWDAEVQSECNDALVANGLDHLVAASVTGTDITDNSIVAKMVSSSATADWDSFVNTTDSLQAIRDKQTDIETDTQDLQTQVGTAGAGLTDLGGMSTAMKAEVNTEVLDVLNTDTFAEPGQEAPGATVPLSTKIGYLYKAWRNKSTQTSTTYSLYADDTTTVDQKSTVSDDGTTATRGEIATGP